jgi:GntR family transcriptional regulator
MLADLLGVSIGTLRKALASLERQRLVERRQGRGTFVPAQTAERALFHFFHIVDLDGRKVAPTSLVLDLHEGEATAEEAAAMRLDPVARVLRIKRLRAIGEAEPILERILLPAALFPEFRLPVLRKMDDELYVIYERDFDVTVARAEERLAAVTADEGDALLLRLAPGAPLLEIDRIAYDRAGLAVERRVTLLDTSAHRYLSVLE